jgi:hypothetical protein
MRSELWPSVGAFQFAQNSFSQIVGFNFTSVRWESAHVLRDPILDLSVNCAVQLGEHVCVQIAASGLDQVRFCYAPCLGFPNAVTGKMLRRIFILVHRRVDVLHDPRLQEVESMIGHRCAS